MTMISVKFLPAYPGGTSGGSICAIMYSARPDTRPPPMPLRSMPVASCAAPAMLRVRSPFTSRLDHGSTPVSATMAADANGLAVGLKNSPRPESTPFPSPDWPACAMLAPSGRMVLRSRNSMSSPNLKGIGLPWTWPGRPRLYHSMSSGDTPAAIALASERPVAMCAHP